MENENCHCLNCKNAKENQKIINKIDELVCYLTTYKMDLKQWELIPFEYRSAMSDLIDLMHKKILKIRKGID